MLGPEALLNLCRHFLANLNAKSGRKIVSAQQTTFLLDLLKLKLVSKSVIDKFCLVASRRGCSRFDLLNYLAPFRTPINAWQRQSPKLIY